MLRDWKSLRTSGLNDRYHSDPLSLSLSTTTTTNPVGSSRWIKRSQQSQLSRPRNSSSSLLNRSSKKKKTKNTPYKQNEGVHFRLSVWQQAVRKDKHRSGLDAYGERRKQTKLEQLLNGSQKEGEAKMKNDWRISSTTRSRDIGSYRPGGKDPRRRALTAVKTLIQLSSGLYGMHGAKGGPERAIILLWHRVAPPTQKRII